MADRNNAQIGAGVQLLYWDEVTSPNVYSALGKVRSINGIGVSRPEVGSTTLESTAEERIAGLPDGKQVTIVLTTTGPAIELVELFRDLDVVDLKLVIPAPATKTRYFSIVPLDDDLGTITANALQEITIQGRITGAIASTDPHGA